MVLACWLGGLENMFTLCKYHQLQQSYILMWVIWENNKVYIFGSMTLKTTHVRGKGGYNGWMTLKLGRCVCVRYLRMCAKFHGSMINSLGENPFGGGGLQKIDDRLFFKFSSKFFGV